MEGECCLLGGSTIYLGSSSAPLGSPEPGRTSVAPRKWLAWSATCLGNIIANRGSHCFLEPALLVAWEAVLLRGEALLAWKTLLSAWEIALSAWEALSLAECLTAQDLVLLAMWGEGGLPPWEKVLLALSSWEGVLLGWTALTICEAALSLGLPPWESVLLALPTERGVLVLQTVLAFWEAALTQSCFPGS